MGGMSRTLCLFFGWPLSRSSHHIFIKACAQAHAVDVYDDDDDDDAADDDDDVIM